jgi:hypothetical protein
MTAAAPRTFPAPRTYHNWLRELAPSRPRRLWFSHLLVHRVEALVAVARPCRLDPLPLALLRRLFAGGPAAPADALARLHFDRQFAAPLLRDLGAAGLLRRERDAWTLSDAGRPALRDGAYIARSRERRAFYFLDAHAGEPPQFLPLTQTAGPAPDVGEPWAFDPSCLQDAIRRPPEWKKRFGFPADVEGVVAEPAEGWRQVVFDRAEHAPLLFVEVTADAASVLLGLLVRPDNWTLQREPPALVLAEGWQNLLPEFAASFSPEVWREAWLAWCQARQPPLSDAAACHVEYADCKVHVQAPKALVERLKAARSEVLRGETWLTLGAGRTRAAGCVEIHEQESVPQGE